MPMRRKQQGAAGDQSAAPRFFASDRDAIASQTSARHVRPELELVLRDVLVRPVHRELPRAARAAPTMFYALAAATLAERELA